MQVVCSCVLPRAIAWGNEKHRLTLQLGRNSSLCFLETKLEAGSLDPSLKSKYTKMSREPLCLPVTVAGGVLLFRSGCPRKRGQGEGRRGRKVHVECFVFTEMKKQTVFFLTLSFLCRGKKKVYRTLIFLLQLSEEKN